MQTVEIQSTPSVDATGEITWHALIDFLSFDTLFGFHVRGLYQARTKILEITDCNQERSDMYCNTRFCPKFDSIFVAICRMLNRHCRLWRIVPKETPVSELASQGDGWFAGAWSEQSKQPDINCDFSKCNVCLLMFIASFGHKSCIVPSIHIDAQPNLLMLVASWSDQKTRLVRCFFALEMHHGRIGRHITCIWSTFPGIWIDLMLLKVPTLSFYAALMA